MQILGRELTAGALAWVLVAVLVAALGLPLLRRDWPFDATERAGDTYVAAAERAAAADRSQALRMQLEAQYAGPLRDTTVQRWRDPVDGTICYIYLPVAVAHMTGPPGLVQYGSANIGSISCLPASSKEDR